MYIHNQMSVIPQQVYNFMDQYYNDPVYHSKNVKVFHSRLQPILKKENVPFDITPAIVSEFLQRVDPAKKTHALIKSVYKNPTFHTIDPTQLLANVKQFVKERRLRGAVYHITLSMIKKFLHRQKEYQRASVEGPKYQVRGQRKPVQVNAWNVKWEADLIVWGNDYNDWNDGYVYILTIIDVFSKYAFGFPLKDKSAATVSNIFNGLFRYSKPRILETDNGSEFKNKELRRVCEEHLVHLLHSHSERPLGYIERFNSTLKTMLLGYLATEQGRKTRPHNKRWIHILDKTLENYNHSPHHSLQGISPATMQFCDQTEAHCEMMHNNVRQYNQAKYSKNPEISTEEILRVGDLVVVLAYLNPFLNASENYAIRRTMDLRGRSAPLYAQHVFRVSKVLRTRPPLFNSPIIVQYELEVQTLSEELGWRKIARKYFHHEVHKISMA